MVCIPCIVIPFVLWLFHKYIQPLILKFWNPWEKKNVTDCAPSPDAKVCEGSQVKDDMSNKSTNIGKDTAEYAYIQQMIRDHTVMVFSKTTCGYCGMVREVFDKLGVDYEIVEIDERKDCDKLQDILQALTGDRTVPRVFVGGKFIGGGTDTYSLHNQGKLLPILHSAGATFKKTK